MSDNSGNLGIIVIFWLIVSIPLLSFIFYKFLYKRWYLDLKAEWLFFYKNNSYKKSFIHYILMGLNPNIDIVCMHITRKHDRVLYGGLIYKYIKGHVYVTNIVITNIFEFNIGSEAFLTQIISKLENSILLSKPNSSIHFTVNIEDVELINVLNTLNYKQMPWNTVTYKVEFIKTKFMN